MLIIIIITLLLAVNSFNQPNKLIFDKKNQTYYLIIENTYCELDRYYNNVTIDALGYNESNIINVKDFNSLKESLEPSKRLNCPIYSVRFGTSYCESYRLKTLYRIRYLSNYLDMDIIESIQNIGSYRNPSIIPFHSRLLMIQSQEPRIVLTNHHFKEFKEMNYFIKKNLTDRDVDIRIIQVPKENDTYMLVYTYKIYPSYHYTEMRKLYHNSINKSFSISTSLRLDVINPQDKEKNFSPFEYDNEILFIRHINPFQVIKMSDKPIYTTLFVHKHVKNQEMIDISFHKCKDDSSIYWDYGEMLGGTPAFLIKDYGYLAFFHSFVTACHRQFFMGAYIFSEDIPFKLLKISYQPIISKELIIDIHDTIEGSSITYPMSYYILDDYGDIVSGNYIDIKPNRIVLTVGINDTNTFIVTLNFDVLLTSLIDVNC